MPENNPICYQSDKKKLEQYEITDQSSELKKWSALIRFYFHENPANMSEDEFYEAYGQLVYALNRTAQMKS